MPKFDALLYEERNGVAWTPWPGSAPSTASARQRAGGIHPSSHRRKRPDMTDLPTPQDAAKAFIYGYPLVTNLEQISGFVDGTGGLPLHGPYNTFVPARNLLGPETKFVTPNNDTLYLMAMCDVRETPVLLTVPDTARRYYVLQFVDAWTNNFAYVGARATGTGPGRFFIVHGDAPSTVPDDATVIHAPTGIFSIVGRVQVNGADDLPAVHAVQDAFSLEVVAAGPAPAGVPTPDPGADPDLTWWEAFRVQFAAFPPPAGDAEFVALTARLGLQDATSPFIEPDPDLKAVLVGAEAAGRALIEELASGKGAALVHGWRDAAHIFDYNRDFFEVGTLDAPEWRIADSTTAYATRSAAARAGLWGNHGYEADYFLTYVDDGGEQLSGSRRYELRLTQPPPVDAFWSLTMYDATDFFLVSNPIDRYSIGDRTEGLVTADDGSITIVLQADRPAAPERAANWLPTPTGDFRPCLRLYVPGPEVLDGTWAIPPISRVE